MNIIPSATELPEMKAKLDALSKKLTAAQELKDKETSDALKAEIKDLEKKVESYEREIGLEIDKITQESQPIRDEHAELENELNGNEELYSKKEILKDVYQQKKSDLGKKLKAKKQELEKYDSLLDEYNFYLEHIGKGSYRKQKQTTPSVGAPVSDEKAFWLTIGRFFSKLWGRLRKVKRKWYIWMVVILLVAIPVCILFDYIYLFTSQEISWQITKIKDSEEAYAKYKDDYYASRHFEEAAGRHAEKMWERVKDIKEPYKLIHLFNDNRFEDAKYREMLRIKCYDVLWDSVKTVNSIEAYGHYLRLMSRGTHRQEAIDSVNSLEQQMMKNWGSGATDTLDGSWD
ncbi:MAG: hypothetical protein JW801_01045 [Bacteroidales bacterium]|nr:hypothetical protein [Bacteroidales bacterium]